MIRRVGVFFDGTGENIWNDMAINDGSLSNVAKLYQLYDSPTSGYETFYAVGVGTEAYSKNHTFTKKEIGQIRAKKVEKDSFYRINGLAFGEGMKDLVLQKLAEVNRYISNHPNEEIIVDVFGFSRGAAEARDFINEFNAINTGIYASAIGFVGLFDTVASEGVADEYNYNLNLNLSEKSAQKIVQLRAKDELRANFPLESLANTPNIIEESLLGVHSDIGGGYGELDMSKKTVVNSTTKIYANKQSGLDEVVKLQARAKQKGYEFYYSYEHLSISDEWFLRTVYVEIREFGFGLSNLALNKMYDYISSSKIDLPPLSILGVTQNGLSNYAIPLNIDKSYVHMSASNFWYGESVADWLTNHKSLSGKRVIYDNEPASAEVKLTLLSKEDKTLLHFNNKSYTIIGTDEEFDEIQKSINQNNSNFTADRLEYLKGYLD